MTWSFANKADVDGNSSPSRKAAGCLVCLPSSMNHGFLLRFPVVLYGIVHLYYEECRTKWRGVRASIASFNDLFIAHYRFQVDTTTSHCCCYCCPWIRRRTLSFCKQRLGKIDDLCYCLDKKKMSYQHAATSGRQGNVCYQLQDAATSFVWFETVLPQINLRLVIIRCRRADNLMHSKLQNVQRFDFKQNCPWLLSHRT